MSNQSIEKMIKKTNKIIEKLKDKPEQKTQVAFYTGLKKGLEYCKQKKQEK